ncbi:ribonuclease HI family protein [Virgibacillus salinus]|uniref:RNase HI n=1 Tax=Virgibacillus salinus TaxID=553311 RepID=A0A1H0YR31_9BACI|nr:ribonuclease HI family protein [Virgibacillus salinus]SDQ17677.1 RNase HI [Virgibacillus salinus]
MINVYTDGASNGNPGISGAGVYIKANGKIYEYSFPLGEMSNHEAEFHAVLKALEICLENFPDEILSFRSDSKLVVDTIEKDFTKNQTFLPLLEKIRDNSSSFPYFFIKWIPDKNNYADKLARKAIQRDGGSGSSSH